MTLGTVSFLKELKHVGHNKFFTTLLWLFEKFVTRFNFTNSFEKIWEVYLFDLQNRSKWSKCYNNNNTADEYSLLAVLCRYSAAGEESALKWAADLLPAINSLDQIRKGGAKSLMDYDRYIFWKTVSQRDFISLILSCQAEQNEVLQHIFLHFTQLLQNISTAAF